MVDRRPIRQSLGRCRAIALIVIFFLVSLFPLAELATAGQGGATPAGIFGQVNDESGAVLPGVTVTVTSPALQLPQLTAVTDERGEYRLTPLPIGSYVVQFELSGFQTLRVEDVQLTVGFVARVDAPMKISGLAETLTVSGVAPIVDVTSAATRTSLTQEAIRVLPSGESGMFGLLAQVPGVRPGLDVGGSQAVEIPAFVSNGQRVGAYTLVEGVLVGRQNSAGNASHVDFTSVDGARIQTTGNSAEMPKSGMLIDVVMKSGGNDFSGEFQWTQSHKSLQADNLTPELIAQGLQTPPTLRQRYIRSAQLGGKIIQDKLWFYTGWRARRDNKDFPGALNPDGSPVLHPLLQWTSNNKVSYQPRANDKFIGFVQLVKDDEPAGVDQFNPVETMNHGYSTYVTGKVEWQGIRGNGLVMSVQHGLFDSTSWRVPHEDYATGRPASLDAVTLQVRGDSIQERDNAAYTHHTRGVVSIYKPDSFIGSHEIKVGFDNIIVTSDNKRPNRPSGNYQLIFQSGVPFQLVTYNRPIYPVERSINTGVYVQDAFSVGRLTLSLGLRVARDNAFVPAQCRDAGQFAAAECFEKIQPDIWSSFGPRLHAVYNLRGNGKSVLKGGWGRFPQTREVQDFVITQLNANQEINSTWRWRDLNGNRDYDPGEVNLDPNGPDFVTFGNLRKGVVNPNERQPIANEFSLAYEQQLVSDLALRISSVYATNKNVVRSAEVAIPYEAYNIPITNPDPGPDGRVGTADDPGTTWTYYDYPAALRGARFQTLMSVNDDPRSDNSFKTIEMAAIKRLRQDWQLSASYAATKKHVPFGQGVGIEPGPFYNPNAEVNAGDNTLIWTFKLAASYIFPKGILGAVNFLSQSGDRLARDVRFTGGTSIPAQVLRVEPMGSIKLPAARLLDVRGSKIFTFGSRRRAEVYVDVFNVLNTNTPTAVVVRSGPSFMVPTAIVLPRVAQVGARFFF